MTTKYNKFLDSYIKGAGTLQNGSSFLVDGDSILNGNVDIVNNLNCSSILLNKLNVENELTELDTKTTDIKYNPSINTTSLNNNLVVSGNFNLGVSNMDVYQTINDLNSDTIDLTYTTTTNTSNFSNNVNIKKQLYIGGQTTDILTVLNGKANLSGGALFTGPINFNGATVVGLNKSTVGLNNVDNTADANKPLSTAATVALASKLNIFNPSALGTLSAPVINLNGMDVATQFTTINNILKDQSYILNTQTTNFTNNLNVNGKLSLSNSILDVASSINSLNNAISGYQPLLNTNTNLNINSVNAKNIILTNNLTTNSLTTNSIALNGSDLSTSLNLLAPINSPIFQNHITTPLIYLNGQNLATILAGLQPLLTRSSNIDINDIKCYGFSCNNNFNITSDGLLSNKASIISTGASATFSNCSIQSDKTTLAPYYIYNSSFAAPGSNYALSQDKDGKTTINAATNQQINHTINNNVISSINADGTTILSGGIKLNNFSNSSLNPISFIGQSGATLNLLFHNTNTNNFTVGLLNDGGLDLTNNTGKNVFNVTQSGVMTCNNPYYNIVGVCSGVTYRTNALIGSNTGTQDANTGTVPYLGWGATSNWSNTGKFIISVAGYYQFNCNLVINSSRTDSSVIITLNFGTNNSTYTYNNANERMIQSRSNMSICYSGYLNVNDTIFMKLDIDQYTPPLSRPVEQGSISINFAPSFSNFTLYKVF